MVLKKRLSKLRFVYSYPYEESFLKLAGIKPTEILRSEGQRRVRFAQKVWNKYENKILRLFSFIYKIRIPEKSIKAYISLVAPNSFSEPLTITLKHWPDIEKNRKSERGFVYATIHELAHYLSYTREKIIYFNKLLAVIQKINILNDRKANLHYLIQAVELGIIGEVFGSIYAEYLRKWIIKNWKNNEYGKSATLLKKHKVPLDKFCLNYIENLLVGGSILKK